MSSDRQFDIVVFGATGYTGKNVVECLGKRLSRRPGLKWAVAGRNEMKLKKVLGQASENIGVNLESGRGVGIVICDVRDELSLVDMAGKTRLVLNCVGPYRFSGEAVVKACLVKGTHHVDVSGEPQFLETMQLKHHKEAEAKGVYVIGSCGFDSVPAELGCNLLHEAMDGPVNCVETYLKVSNEGRARGPSINFGTWQSAIHGVANAAELRSLRRELFPDKLPRMEPRMVRRRPVHRSRAVGSWCTVFEGSDRSVMLRSERARMEMKGKRPSQIQSYLQLPSLLAVFALVAWSMVFWSLAKFKFGRHLLETFPYVFSLGNVTKAGPAKEVVENCNFELTLIGKGWRGEVDSVGSEMKAPENRTVRVVVKGKNIGYGATCECMLEAGLTILDESDRMPGSGGVLPPGVAFESTEMTQRLNAKGVTFNVAEIKDSSE